MSKLVAAAVTALILDAIALARNSRPQPLSRRASRAPGSAPRAGRSRIRRPERGRISRSRSTIEVVDGKVTGSLKPFLGGEDGATIVDARIVGEELQATAVVGRPRPGGVALAASGSRAGDHRQRQSSAGRGRGAAPRGWKDSVRIAFVFRNEGLQGVNLVGTADVTMSDVPWMKFKYALSKKRSRY